MTNRKKLANLATDFAMIAQQLDLIGQDLAWLKSLRLQALAQFNQHGLPSKKCEDWKYASLWGFSQQQFNHQAKPTSFNSRQCDDLALLSDATRVVIVDGVFSAKLSQLIDLQSGVTISNLATGFDTVQAHINQQIDIEKAGFNALNTLLMNDGVVITVDSSVIVEQTIEILFINTGETVDLASHLRNVIVLAENSQATVIEHYIALNDAPYLTNVVTEVVLAEQAGLKHYKLQQESDNAFHIATLAAKQATASQLNTASISLGAKLARHDIHSQLLGETSHVMMDGIYLATDEQYVDHHTRIDHAAANTTSEELFKGVMNDNSHAVFNGKVIVHKDAQKTDANQQNHNLLLSRSCEIDSKPEMEIYADDVKCGHGSTVGQLNEDALFFLRARGLDEVAARSLLTHAFAVDVLERIADKDIRQALSAVIEQKLPRGGVK